MKTKNRHRRPLWVTVVIDTLRAIVAAMLSVGTAALVGGLVEYLLWDLMGPAATGIALPAGIIAGIIVWAKTGTAP